MDWFRTSITGLPPFLLYFAIGALLIFIFAVIYQRLTRHDEMALVRQGNLAAALALGGNVAGFSIPVDRSVSQAAHIPDLLLWAVIAAFVQFLVYQLMRFLIADISGEIERNNVAAGALLGTVAVVSGFLNAAAMTQ